MKAIYNNLINGNLSEAKEQAASYNVSRIAAQFQDFGMSAIRAAKAARYLKDMGTFQEYADSK